MPAPTDVPAINTVDEDGNPIGERKCSDDEPFAGLAFKVINDTYGALTFVRVYSGVLAKGMSVTNTTRGKREKIGRMVEMFAAQANPIEEARAGDIIALVSLAETDTGDTLWQPDSGRSDEWCEKWTWVTARGVIDLDAPASHDASVSARPTRNCGSPAAATSRKSPRITSRSPSAALAASMRSAISSSANPR